MSATLVVPFNFQPSSVSVKTASYTIPAGKYAKVTVNIDGTGTFTIDGSTALSASQNSVLATSPLATDGTGRLTTTTAAAGSPAAYTSETDKRSVVADYFLPAGTVIAGSGTWRAVVQEFSNIT
jgi:hypothetical protein